MTQQLHRRDLLLSTLAMAVASLPAAALAARPARLALPDAEWRRRLAPATYQILRRGGTERPYSSPLNKEHRAGLFACAGCALPLFSSRTKFDSRTGWPSFWAPLPDAVTTKADYSLFMARTEVLCARCSGHLGHVFSDGPRPTGQRYCMNGAALRFTARG